MDRVGADFERVVRMIRERLGANAIPIQLPIGVEDAFCGVVDLLEQKAIYWNDESLGASFEVKELPEELVPAASQAREVLVEAAAEFDEALAARFLDDEPIGPDPLRKAIREGTLRMQLVPVLCGAAFKNKGVQPLLDAVVDFLPSPLDVPPVQGHHPHTNAPETRKADDNEPFAALAFKLMTDKHVGHLTYMRVYSGSVKTGDQVLNPTRGKKERIGRLLQMHANKRQEIEEAFAGDIAAVVGLKAIRTGETLCSVQHPIVLEVAPVPRARDLDRDRAEDERRHGEALRLARPARAGGPVLPRARRPGDGADDHLGDGRAPPRDHHRPALPRVRGAGERRASRRSPTRRRSRARRPPRAATSSRRAARATTAS